MEAGTNLSLNSKGGFSLIEGMVTIALLSIAGMALMSLNVTAMKSIKSSDIRVDLIDTKRTIGSMLSCEETFRKYGTNRPIACSSSDKIDLKDKNGRDLVKAGKVGDWNIEARCEVIGTPASNGLSIYATKQKPDGSYKMDPIRNIPLDRSHPISLLYKPGVRLCGDYFSAKPLVAGCPDGVRSANFQDETYTCLPSCQYVSMGYDLPAAYRMTLRYKTAPPIYPKSCPAGTSLKTKFLSGTTTVSWSTNNPKTGHTSHSQQVFETTLVCCPN